MGLGDFVNKAKEQLSSERAEQLSDSALDRARDFASERTGGKYDDKITSVRDAIDERVGNQGAVPANAPATDEGAPPADPDQQP